MLLLALLLDISPPRPPAGIGKITEGGERRYVVLRGLHPSGRRFRIYRGTRRVGMLELDAKAAEANEIKLQIWRILPLEGTRLEDLRQGDVVVPTP